MAGVISPAFIGLLWLPGQIVRRRVEEAEEEQCRAEEEAAQARAELAGYARLHRDSQVGPERKPCMVSCQAVGV
eukprot:scaffold123139_cov16-Prasinocladus_malaysianus.AAC.1